jgi:hypothetical protein
MSCYGTVYSNQTRQWLLLVLKDKILMILNNFYTYCTNQATSNTFQVVKTLSTKWADNPR